MTHNTSLYYLWKNNTPTPSECAIEICKGDICILGRSDGLTTVYVDKEIDASLNWEDLYVVDSYSEYNLNLSHDPITLCEIGRDGKILGDVIALNTLKGLYRSEWMYDFFSETENILNGSIRHWSKSLLSRIISIEEKPEQTYFVNAGIYVLNPEVVAKVNKEEFFDMPELFTEIIGEGQKAGIYPVREYWLDIGRLDDFKRAQMEFEKLV